MNPTHNLARYALPKLPTWALLALLAAAFLSAGHLDNQHELDAPQKPRRTAANLDEAIALACHTHGAKGRVNRHGDIQCIKDGKPTYYVHVARVQP